LKKKAVFRRPEEKFVKMAKTSFVNTNSWKKSRYMLPKTAFVLATFCMLYMAYNPSASSSSKGLSSKQGPLSMSQAELDSLYKGHSGDSSEQQNVFYYESGIAGQSLFQRHLMAANDEGDGGAVTDEGAVVPEGNCTFQPEGNKTKMCKCRDDLAKKTGPSTEKEKNGDFGDFPTDVFNLVQLRHGAILFHIAGILYMFFALALVCDEFFVPSLDVIADKLKITPDVAGATFMAAGGSAPELFTSIIGVFIAKSDVGIGTIVGSAVFNILFVIAACAFAAKEALELTAWPLMRDVFFYSVSLIVLVVFFNDNKIFWYEALVLFLWYFCYVIFMKFNEATEDKLRSCLGFTAINREEGSGGCTLRKSVYRKGLFHLMNETINPGILKKTSSKEGYELQVDPQQSSIMIGHQQAHAAGQGITGLKTQLQLDSTGEATANGAQENGKDDMEDPDAPKVTNPAAADGDNSTAVQIVENNTGDGDNAANDKSKDAEVAKDAEEDEEAEEPIDMSFPKGGDWKKILIYLISFPIMFPLYYTLPDTKKPKLKKFFIVTFFGSILWIAGYSYLMVWWATVAGKVFGIPDTVMGLTFLAAGTSVPDLITSVLVAKQGKGDMAVSSSVGSNIFDVTVGLPVPWLIFTAVNQHSVPVSSGGVGCSISLLFIMLIFVFLSILACKWKMTKGMGVFMGCLYFVFVIITVGFDFCWYVCPI